MKSSRSSASKYNSPAYFSTPSNMQNRGSRSFLGLIDSFVGHFFKSIPFSLRVFMRKDLGSMTFSWGTILLAALWVRFILDGTFNLDEFVPPETFQFSFFNKGNGVFYYLAVAFWYVGMFFNQFVSVIIEFIPPEFKNQPMDLEDFQATLPFFISLGVIVLGIFNKWQIKRKHDQKIVFDPLDKGKSFFFEELLDWIKPKDRKKVLLWFEVGFLLLITILLSKLNQGDNRWVNYLGFFLIGTGAMVLEELITSQRRKREIEIRMANEIKAQEMQADYEAYKKEAIGTAATVSFVAASLLARQRQVKKIAGPISLPISLVNLLPNIRWRVNRQQLKFPVFLIIGIGLVILILNLAVILSEYRETNGIYETAIVQKVNLTLRRGPSLSAGSMGIITRGSIVQIINCGYTDDEGREWCKIKHNGKTGYCSRQGTEGDIYLSMDELPGELSPPINYPFNDTVLTRGNGKLNLRKLPSIHSEVIRLIPNKSLVLVLGCGEETETIESKGTQVQGRWCQVKYEGDIGYCFSWYLSGHRNH